MKKQKLDMGGLKVNLSKTKVLIIWKEDRTADIQGVAIAQYAEMELEMMNHITNENCMCTRDAVGSQTN